MKFDVQKYFEISTIHGLAYLSKRFHIAQRIFWIIALILSVIYTSFLIVQLVIKVMKFPIVSYLSDQSIPVSEINFPAVTVCPQWNLFRIPDSAYSFRQKHYSYEKHTLRQLYYEHEEEEQEFEDEMKFGNISYAEFLDRIENGSIKPEQLGIKILKRLQVVDILKDRNIFNKLNFSIPTDDFFEVMNVFQKEFFPNSANIAFLWIGEFKDFVSEIVTQWGLCFTYNIGFHRDVLHINSTSEDFHYQNARKVEIPVDYQKRYKHEHEPQNLPQKISTSKAGLWVGFNLKWFEIEKVLNNTFGSYTLLLHDPLELPSANSKIVHLNLKFQTTILSNPQMNTIDKSLAGYEPAERNCYLENEKVLKFFKVYTKNNCENECLTDFILSRCGCVEFFMIRNSSTRICSANERHCYKKAADDFEEQKRSCNCYKPCNHIEYGYEQQEYGNIDTNVLFPYMNIGFRLQYKENVFNQLIRKKQFNELDFLSYVGGILGLFAGFSALSMVELIYWFSFRVFVGNRSDIPFPAITVVPQFTIPYELSSDISDIIYEGPSYFDDLYNDTTEVDERKIMTKYYFCEDLYNAYYFKFNFSFVPYVIPVLRENTQLALFRDQFSSFNGKYQPEFAEIRTSRGMGFTFNMIDADEMFNFDHSDFNYTRNITTRSRNSMKLLNYPLSFNKNVQTIFSITLKDPQSFLHDCIKQSFVLHQSDESPTFNSRKDFVAFDNGMIIGITVTPEIIKTDRNLIHLKPAERGCYFDDEKSLKFFKKYSQNNCEIECFANITMDTCGCVDFDQPFSNPNELCLNISRMDSTCTSKLKTDIYASLDFSPESSCSCLPLCNSISYNIKYYTKHESGGNETTINVRMNMDDIVLFRRYQQFTFSDVVSYVGGLLGLFAGISMLSIVEFFYFFTIRIFWVIALIFSVTCTSILIGKVVIKVLNFPIVAYLSDQSVPLSEINFPAVTICPKLQPFFVKDYKLQKYYKYEKHSIEEYFLENEEYLQETEDERKFGNISYVEFLDRIDNGSIKPKKLAIKLLKRLQVIDLVTNRGTFQNLNISIPTDDFLDILNQFPKQFRETISIVFYWINQLQFYMSEVITPWGLCFTYNIAFSHDLLNLNSTSDDFHYQHFHRTRNHKSKNNRLPSSFPKSVSTSNAGLWVGFTRKISLNEGIQNDFIGFKVILHNPLELPSKNSKVINFNEQFQSEIKVDAQVNSIDEALYGYEPAERNCYLENEKILKFFKVYTRNNCKNECLTDFMLSRCGCVEFFMIRNSSTRICSANEQSCYKKATDDFKEQKSDCGCLLPCNYVKYDFELNRFGIAEDFGLISDLQRGFKIRYKSSVFNQLIRKKQFNELDFLSFVGGILGLFAGFSALSFVELIYWFTIRVVIKNCRIGLKQVNPEVENDQNESNMTKIRDSMLSYFNESSVHGLNHIIELSKIGYKSSIFWTFFTMSAMTLCVHLMLGAREKVPNSRIIAYDDNYKFVDNVTITIVPSFTIPREWIQTKTWTLIAHYAPYGKSLLNNKATKEPFKRGLTHFHFCMDRYEGYKFGYTFSFVPYLFTVLKMNSKVDWFRDQFSSFNGKYQPEFAEIRTSRGMGFTFNMIDAGEMFNFDQADQAELILQFKPPTDGKWPCLIDSLLVHDPDFLPTFSSRFFWIVALAGSAVCSSILIFQLVIKMQNLPIIVFLSDQLVFVSELNFPAITICPHVLPFIRKTFCTKIKSECYFRYEKHTLETSFYEIQEYLNEFEDEMKFGNFSYLDILTKIEDETIKLEQLGIKLLKRLQVIDLVTNRGTFQKLNFLIPTDDFLDVINEFAKEFIITSTSMNFEWIKELKLFGNEVITPWGLCFTFNMAHSRDMLNLNITSSDFHYQYTAAIAPDYEKFVHQLSEPIPRKISTIKAGFFANIMPNYQDFEQAIEDDIDGYLFIIHDPYELPSRNAKSLRAKLLFRTNVILGPLLNEIDESLHDYEPVERNCYLENEKVLKFFKVYTKNNCENECLTDFMLSRCGCVEFFMIRNSSTRICSANEQSCYKKAEDDFEEQKRDCDCFNPCDYVEYNFEATETVMDVNYPVLSDFDEFNIKSLDVLINFNQETYNPLIRKQQYTTLDLLSFVGGILGLFAGFSALSFIELIYWFTIRVFIVNFNVVDTKVYTLNQNDQKKSQFKEFFKTFFSESSIHGLNYINKFTRLDSFFWIIFIISAMTCCIYLTLSVNDKVPDSLVLAFDDNLKPINDISFPAVTITPAYTVPLEWVESETLFDKFYNREYVSNIKVEKELTSFKRISSDFNYTRNITTKSASLTNIPKSMKYPLKFNKLDQAAFTLKLNRVPGEYWECIKQSFMIHSSDDFPTFNPRRNFIPYDYDKSVDVIVSVEITKTEENLKKLAPIDRECYFEGERSLNFFKKYTQKNCDIECFTNITLKSCGCVDIEQPFITQDQICLNASRYPDDCVLMLQHTLYELEYYSSEENCSCLPLCNSISYNIKYYTKHESGGNETTINVRMNMDDIVLFRRYQQFTFSDVVSYVGGLLGLFAGISMLSIVEFFYFFTIRLGVNLWRMLRGDEDLNH
ncbi:unnamed protein product [Chironomus riparius]|uniref:Uncharacterized protein n=1 Tax=Chironomus riparius TaxID=315576 RepID=A0A9N9SA98_9DIPT|nr:unnamed protein product [Chironomus riparius]